jgi:hypothetical protein
MALQIFMSVLAQVFVAQNRYHADFLSPGHDSRIIIFELRCSYHQPHSRQVTRNDM